jgi:hypothetical protein
MRTDDPIHARESRASPTAVCGATVGWAALLDEEFPDDATACPRCLERLRAKYMRQCTVGGSAAGG